MTTKSDSEAPDLLVVGGDVRTTDPRRPRAQALAARAGRLVAIGSTAELEGLCGPRTETIDVHGATVLPGLIDAHGHFGHVARSMAGAVDCRTPPISSILDIVDRAATRARAVPPGTWILLQGTTFQDELIADGRFPTPAELTAVSNEHPIVYRSSLHHVVANRCALALAGIDANTVEPPGAHIERDPASGEPTGVLAEMFDRLPIPAATEAQLAASIHRVAWEHYLAHGVTSIQEIWDSVEPMRLLARAIRAREIPLRVRGLGWVPLAGTVAELASGAIGDVPLERDWFEGGAVKLFADGGTSSHTAAFYEEYLDAPGRRGALNHELGELAELIAEAQRAGAQVAVHAAGDLAQDLTLAAFELAGSLTGSHAGELLGEEGRVGGDAGRLRPGATVPVSSGANPYAHLRPRIEHGANTAWSARRTEWCRRLGVLPVANLGFIHNYGEFWPRSLGERRSRECVPLRSLLDAGFQVPGTSDTTGGDPRLLNPFHNIWCAVTRETFAGRTIDPNQRISREEGLSMYTRFAAHAGHWETSRGMLAPGMLADVVVLGEALDDVSDGDLGGVTVAQTIVDGRLVYERA
jgi:predicted amidohydrolase YtcJ